MKYRIVILVVLQSSLTGCDVLGLPATYVRDESDVLTIAVDDSYVYWATCNANTLHPDDRVMRVPKSGGRFETLAADQFCPRKLFSDRIHVYWLTRSGMAQSIQTSGTPMIRYSGYDVRAFAVDEANVYWIDCVLPIKTAMLMKRPKQGGEGSKIAWVSDCGSGIAVDASNIYWLDGMGLNKASKDGGTSTTICRLGLQVGDLLADDTNLYWIQGYNIWHVAKTGGTPEILADKVTIATPLAMDRTHLYWITENGAIVRIAKNGGTPTIVATEPPAAQMVVDATHIYWTNPASARVIRKTK
ncbi:MAG: hypothetical protein HY868_20645 [Chloroflexi bacterium]|nr:hypothetical protein [Chloroflexota bacterium]